MNFGWNDFEGLHETSFGTGGNASPKVDPIARIQPRRRATARSPAAT